MVRGQHRDRLGAALKNPYRQGEHWRSALHLMFNASLNPL
jgi:hypothetical protein